MEFSLGVSMTPTAVRLVLVEGATADGASIDHFGVPAGDGVAQRVVAAILGTRESVEEGGHQPRFRRGRLDRPCIGGPNCAERYGCTVARPVSPTAWCWSRSCMRLVCWPRQSAGWRLRAHRLLFLDGSTATLAVVRTADGAVVRVHTRRLGRGRLGSAGHGRSA